MIDKVREWAKAKLKAWNHLAPDGMKNLQPDELDEFKTIRIILALVDVKEKAESTVVNASKYLLVGSAINSKIPELLNALATADERIDEILGGDDEQT